MIATTPKQVLIATKWILTHYGWCQKRIYIGKPKPTSLGNQRTLAGWNIKNGHVILESACLVGAMSLVDDTPEAGSSAYSMISNAIDGTDDMFGGGGLTRWNDKPGRTKKEVIDLLDQLIKRA